MIKPPFFNEHFIRDVHLYMIDDLFLLAAVIGHINAVAFLSRLILQLDSEWASILSLSKDAGHPSTGSGYYIRSEIGQKLGRDANGPA